MVGCAQGGVLELLPQVNARPREQQVAFHPVALNVILRVVFSVMAISALAVLRREKAEFEFPEELPPSPWAELPGWGPAVDTGRPIAAQRISLELGGSQEQYLSFCGLVDPLIRSLAGLQSRCRLGLGSLLKA